MLITEAEFVKSSEKLSDCPKPVYPEYAFFGRSNVGKSSLINMITGKKGLAKISSTPGKTRLLNCFVINQSWYLTDLPGFGFAKVSKSLRAKWDKTIKAYFLKRENLICLFFLIDIRHKPLANDLEYIDWLGSKQIPFAIVFTKSDKLTTNQLKSNLSAYEKKLAERWAPLPDIFVTSSEKKLGREDILNYISSYNENYSDSIKNIKV